MLVTCPNCKSVFKLPKQEDIDKKLRCSICKTVFAIRETEYKLEAGEEGSPQEAGPSNTGIPRIDLDTPFANDKSVKKKSLAVRIFAILFFASICFISILWSFTDYLDPIKEKYFSKDEAKIQEKIEAENKRIEELTQKVKLLQINGLRQYTMPNDKIGTLTVIEGKVVNGFDEPRGFIQVECSLYSESGELLIDKKQIAGTSLSLFQLQVLNEDELERTLNNNLDIMQRNTNIAPGASTPFMCIFYNPPQNAANFNIKIVSAENPEKMEAPQPEQASF